MGLFSGADDEQPYYIQAEAQSVARALEKEAKQQAQEDIKREREALIRNHRRELQLADERRILAAKDEEFKKEQAAIAERKRNREQRELIEHKRWKDRFNGTSTIDLEKEKDETYINMMSHIQNTDMTNLRLVNDLVLCAQITELEAKTIIAAINNGLIPGLSINY